MTLSKILWQENGELAQACLRHPFVQGLAEDTLAAERFAYYVGQDAFFLQAFARAYTIAGAKAPDWQGFVALHRLADGVLEELKLHDTYARRWAVDAISTKPAPATRRYTDFVLATAWGCDTGLTVAALCPCMRLYAFLGQELAKAHPPPQHRYIDWIQTYSSRDIEDLAQQLEYLVDAYVSDSPAARETYRYAMACELDFFQAAYESVS